MIKAAFLSGLLSIAAQTTTGAIEGIVTAPDGALLATVQLHVVNLQTGQSWVRTSAVDGYYRVTALPPGEYRVEARFGPIQRQSLSVRVTAGGTTPAHFLLGEANPTSIEVTGTMPQIRTDSNAVEGWILRDAIESLPVNGRNFLEVAKLEPGIQAPTRTVSNRILIPSLGAPLGLNGRDTRVTVDGGSIMAVGNGGSAMGISQETVYEFQVSTANLDLSTGPTASGVISAVTRSGSNEFHGDAFAYYRDHHLAAYPGLARNPIDLDPFFQRRQYGVTLGGPIRRDRSFFFFNYERTGQRGVSTTTLTDPDFSHLSRISASPLFGNQFNIRLDVRLSESHDAFVRYTHDGGRSFAPASFRPNALPSNWFRQKNWTDQDLLGLTSSFSPTLVNQLRFSYLNNSSRQGPGEADDCPGCLGMGEPMISVRQSRLILGEFGRTDSIGRRYHLSDTVEWLDGAHGWRFGFDFEHNRGGFWVWRDEPAAIELFSPSQARDEGIPTRADFLTVDDILSLPLRQFTTAFGDPRVPQEDGGEVRNWDTLRLFVQDRWRITPRLTLNYGLGWTIDGSYNFDLAKPRLLEPVLGEEGLAPTRKQWDRLSPSLGVAWAVREATVLRAGAGVYYGIGPATFELDNERAALGPPGTGRQTFRGSSILNPVSGIPDVPVDRPLQFFSPTSFSGTDLMTALPQIRADLMEKIQDADPSAQQLEVTKTLPSPGLFFGTDAPGPSALHLNVGLQQRLGADLVLGVDLVYRRFNHFGLPAIDVNHWNSISGPAIRPCMGDELDDPEALCSNGPIRMWAPIGNATYTGLLMRADKRFSRGWQIRASWAYSRNRGTSGAEASGFNLLDWLENDGPLSRDFTHILNVAGVRSLPWGVDLTFNFSYSSVAPFSAYVGNVDFNGDGTTDDLLPGTTFNVFNRGMDAEDLPALVDRFNQTYARGTDARGVPIPVLTLPESYRLGDDFHALDLRLGRSWALTDRVGLRLIAEVFNAYNAANLSGYSGDLAGPASFGQPTARFDQVFGSGGPRAFQLAFRLSF